MINRFTTKERTFKMSPCGRFIRVYKNNRLNGFIWNNDKVILIDGEPIKSSDFFK